MENFVKHSPAAIDRLQRKNQKYNKLMEKVYQFIFFKLLLLLEQIHQINVIHYDIKPGNIVFDEEFNPLFIDYGESEIIDLENPPFVLKFAGTRGYVAPEIITTDYQKNSG